MRGSKFMITLGLFIFLTLITVVSASLTMTTSSDVVGGIVITEDINILNSFGLLRSFWMILTFQIVELPDWITLFVFYPITLATIIMIIETVKGN